MKINIKLELKFDLKNFIDSNVFVFIYIYLINLKISKMQHTRIFEIVLTFDKWKFVTFTRRT